MLKLTTRALVWLGGTASTPALGVDTRSPTGGFVNVLPEGTQPRRVAGHFHPNVPGGPTAHQWARPEMRHAVGVVAQPKPTLSKWNRVLRADLYDELLKLPLRYALHDFMALQKHLQPEPPDEESVTNASGLPGVRRASAVGYAPPLGAVDALDPLPFFVHRTSNGHLPGKIHSMNAKNLMPAFYMRIQNIEGDRFRFEEELLKIFPTKKVFVRSHSVYVYNVNLDGRAILHHWLLGLGF